MKKVLIVIGLVAVAAGAWLAFRGGVTSVDTDTGDTKPKVRRIGAAGEMSQAREQLDTAISSITNRPPRKGRHIRVISAEEEETLWVFEDGTPWPANQKALMREISAAADEEDFTAVAALAGEVSKCENAEIRERFVEELGWFGEKAFVELANFISDPNEEVAESARTQITDAFQEIDSDAEKAALFSLMAKAVSDDDLLETFADELTTMDEVLALQTIVDTLSDGTPKAQKAVKEAYETITDEKWKDVESAENWLASNYDDDDDIDDDAPEAEAVTTKTEKTKTKETSKTKEKTKSTRSSSSRSRSTSTDYEAAEDEGVIEEGEAEGADEGEEIDDEGEGEGEGEDEEMDDEEGFGDEDEAEDSPDEEEEVTVDENGNPVSTLPAPVLVD